MKIFIIAQIISNKAVVGYRLLDVDAKKNDTGRVKDINSESIKQVLNQPNAANLIVNAKLVSGELIGTNGQLSRYAKISTSGILIDNKLSPLVVINKIDELGYTVSDFKGDIRKIKNSDAVGYAKTLGIANGKVIIQDSVEYISSISDSYEQVKTAPSKVGSAGKVNIPIHIAKDVTTIAKHTELDIDAELQYNDVFKALTKEQRNVLTQYYTWYTVEVYRGLAKNVRLNLAPSKAEKLAQLKGTDNWQFAGIVDSHLDLRFNAKCELGHNLRYEFYARPEKDERGCKDNVIIFGETCAGDFFNISPEDMKKLVKTRKIMSDEIELIANIITNHEEEKYKNKCTFLYESLRKMSNLDLILNVFGKQLGYTLLAFNKVGIPFPKSLVILAGDEARKKKITFLNSIYPKNKEVIELMLRSNSRLDIISIGKKLLNFIVQYSIEGEYMYDPLRDDEHTRRDVGQYNKKTREERKLLERVIKEGTLCTCNKITINTLENYLNTATLAFKANKEIEIYVDNSEILKKGFKDNNSPIYEYRGLNYSLQTLIHDERLLHEEKLKPLSVILGCMSFSEQLAYGKYNSLTKKVVVDKYSFSDTLYRNKLSYKTVDEMYEYYRDTLEECNIQELLKNTLESFENNLRERLNKIDEEELNKVRYYMITLKEEAESNKMLGNLRCLLEANREIREKLQDTLGNKESIQDNNYSFQVLGDFIIKSEEIEDAQELSRSTFAYYRESFNSELRKIKRKQEEEEARKREEEEARKIEEEARKKEEEKLQEFKQDNTMQELKELLERHPKSDADYGINVARNILDSKTPYNKLSSKQQWRVNETIKQLSKDSKDGTDTDSSQEDTDSSKEVNAENLKRKLTEENDIKIKVDKILEIAKSKDKKLIEKINSASRLAIDIAKTVSYKGEFSDKQLKHIEKAYDIL